MAKIARHQQCKHNQRSQHPTKIGHHPAFFLKRFHFSSVDLFGVFALCRQLGLGGALIFDLVLCRVGEHAIDRVDIECLVGAAGFRATDLDRYLFPFIQLDAEPDYLHVLIRIAEAIPTPNGDEQTEWIKDDARNQFHVRQFVAALTRQ